MQFDKNVAKHSCRKRERESQLYSALGSVCLSFHMPVYYEHPSLLSMIFVFKDKLWGWFKKILKDNFDYMQFLVTCWLSNLWGRINLTVPVITFWSFSNLLYKKYDRIISGLTQWWYSPHSPSCWCTLKKNFSFIEV